MSNYEMTGTIKRIAEAKVISDSFTVQEFILHVPGDYPQDIKFQAANKTLEYLKPELINQTVTITFDIRGRGTPKGYFNNLNAWKIQSSNSQANAAGNPQTQQQQVLPQVAQTFPNATVEPDVPF